MKDRHIAGRRRRVGKRQHVLLEILVDGQRVQIGLVAHAAEQIAHVPGAVANGVALVRRRHPLIHLHSPCSRDGATGLPSSVGRPR